MSRTFSRNFYRFLHIDRVRHQDSKKWSKSSTLIKFPIAIVSGILLMNEDYSPLPFSVDFLIGPSMMPTVQPEGEVYLRIKSWAMGPPETGHVVVFQDFKGGYACKRIIGVENDEVDSKGEYSSTIYRDRKDLGIPAIPIPNALPAWQNEAQINNGIFRLPARTLWVEGDNPLDSIDSRHYGPVPISNLKGRILYRLWPRRRVGDISSSCIVSSLRPEPMKAAESPMP